MNAFTAMLMGVIPLTLFAWMGSHIRGGIDKKQDAERWLLFLLSIVTLLLAGTLISILSSANQTPVVFLLILPSLWGSQAALFLFFFSRDRNWPPNHLIWALSVFILGLLVWIGIAGELSTVSIIMIRAERMGTLDRDRVWGTLPGQVTESRAEKIDRGIQNFHAEKGAYPQTLSELTPRYLLYIPVPYIIPRQDWCYEGGADYYQLGYVLS